METPIDVEPPTIDLALSNGPEIPVAEMDFNDMEARYGLGGAGVVVWVFVCELILLAVACISSSL